MSSAPDYATRLRAEGITLAATGLAGSALLLKTQPQAKREPVHTIGQLAVLVGALAFFGPRSTAKALDNARPIRFGRVGTGEPTPLWQVPAPVVGQALFVSVVGKRLLAPVPLPKRLKAAAGWDAALRVTAGSAFVGLYQALVIARQVREKEAAAHKNYFRMPGSRLGRGTVLGSKRRLRPAS